jgi:excisionase family DNA binding protein
VIERLGSTTRPTGTDTITMQHFLAQARQLCTRVKGWFGRRVPATRVNGLLSHREAAELLGISPETLRRMAVRGVLPHFKVGSFRRYYSPAELASFILSKKPQKRNTKWIRWIKILKQMTGCRKE